MRTKPWARLLLLLACCLGWTDQEPTLVRGEVVRFEMISRQPYLEGREFGTVGPYEQIVGRVHFAIDPGATSQATIVDLQHAPRNAAGQVEFSSDLFVLAPRDPGRGNGNVLYDVNNRGNKLALRFFNDASGGNDAQDPGNGFLLTRGYTIVWSGWDGELLPGEGRLQLRAPVARPAQPLTGLVRYEICPDKDAPRLSLVRPGHGAYRPTEAGQRSATLTWRLRPTDRRIAIPSEQFRIIVTAGESTPGQLPLVELEVPAGFRRGYLYELIYEAQDPLVHGVCFAAVRDLIAALKHGNGRDNPWPTGIAQRAYGFGVSQSGRFLREFVYAGFNADEQGRLVFDGLMPHVAGGGLGSFNHRFAQPTIFGTQHEYSDWPTDRFPFAYEDQQDPFSRRDDGILRRARQSGTVPKVFHTQSATEYWTRSGSLPHTDPSGRRDTDLPETVRLFAFGGTQHGPAPWPPEKGLGQWPANPGDYRPFLRALLDRLDAWCRGSQAPPPSVYPTIRDRTLVPFSQASTGFPALPGVRYPEAMRVPSLLDFGPDWPERGIQRQQPPARRSDYGALVPRCDADGNDRGCLLPPEVAVPVATMTGWALRSREAGAENDLVGLNGTYLPFPRTAQERQERGDPRPSFAERYGSLEQYLERLERECRRLHAAGYLLEDDVGRVVARERERVGAWLAAP